MFCIAYAAAAAASAAASAAVDRQLLWHTSHSPKNSSHCYFDFNSSSCSSSILLCFCCHAAVLSIRCFGSDSPKRASCHYHLLPYRRSRNDKCSVYLLTQFSARDRFAIFSKYAAIWPKTITDWNCLQLIIVAIIVKLIYWSKLHAMRMYCTFISEWLSEISQPIRATAFSNYIQFLSH